MSKNDWIPAFSFVVPFFFLIFLKLKGDSLAESLEIAFAMDLSGFAGSIIGVFQFLSK